MQTVNRFVANVQPKIKKLPHKVGKAVWQQFFNEAGQTLPVFLVGCGRSGTTMVIRQLDKSWRLKIYHEGDQAAFDNYRLRDFRVIEDLIARSHAPITLFKPILNTTQTPQLLDHFPGSKGIFIFRHFDDVVNSGAKMFGKNHFLNVVRAWMEEDFSEFSFAPPPEKTKALIRDRWNPNCTPEEGGALLWLFYNQLFYDLDLDKDERLWLLQYELVVSQPRQELEALTKFLGFSFEEQTVAGIYDSSIKRDPGPGINQQLRADCEALYERLCQSVKERK